MLDRETTRADAPEPARHANTDSAAATNADARATVAAVNTDAAAAVVNTVAAKDSAVNTVAADTVAATAHAAAANTVVAKDSTVHTVAAKDSTAHTVAKDSGAAPVRFVTAASLFDGHDAAINIVRRILLSLGAEVIHLGHNRSVEDIVTAALQEDARGIAVSSYQGGHVEFFKYMVEMLRERGGDDIRIFAGGGGVIVDEEAAALEAFGVTRVYSPADGQAMGLVGMLEDAMARCRAGAGGGAAGNGRGIDDGTGLGGDGRGIDGGTVGNGAGGDGGTVTVDAALLRAVQSGERRALAQLLSAIEQGRFEMPAGGLGAGDGYSNSDGGGDGHSNSDGAGAAAVPVLGITGTGGAGKSSLTDELILRFLLDYRGGLKIAILAVDPSRRKSGGALLGDRIRMNAIAHPNIFMRSVATRRGDGALPAALPQMVDACKLAGFDLVIVETPGIGQGDSAVAELVDCALYVMTPEYGAASQLEKIDMLDFADLVAINKFDRAGADDAYRDVCKQVQRNREAFALEAESMPVFGSIASKFNDDGVTALYHALRDALDGCGLRDGGGALPTVNVRCSTDRDKLIPSNRIRYLAEIADSVRAYKSNAHAQADIARQIQQLEASRAMLAAADDAANNDATTAAKQNNATELLTPLIAEREQQLDARCKELLTDWPALREQYGGEELTVTVRDKAIRTALDVRTLSGNRVRRVALPAYHDHGDLLAWLMLENLPGRFPFTAGVFAFKRDAESPTRMFAGEGDAARTNRRFKALSAHAQAKRLSTAFDSVTLYGCDPDERPDIYGKVGNSGVSIATLDDLEMLYDGFDLCDPLTSVSMTINGPAPIILAMFLNAAVNQKLGAYQTEHGRAPDDAERRAITADALRRVRGTVQADILKEDQGQNTCIFSIEFSLKLMADIQEYFIQHQVRNFYSVSISGYHIAEAGANPITQLAFTLANGFTYVESYLARGMAIDDFAPNLSFFFSNGMDPEYTVMGRVARRIWAVALRERYGAGERSQKLKYHIQTSGRSLHAQEMNFNDIRTTLQALIAVYDHCNSLHTNAFDEAVTTPTDDSVRRALAIQLIIDNEWGLAFNENPNQGSFIIEQLTELVEEAVLAEFERITERGGVLGAMENGYQRGKIQDESMHYEHKKHDGSLPIIGVNTFTVADASPPPTPQLARSSEEEKQSQINRLRDFHARHAAQSDAALERIKQVALNGGNLFAELVEAVKFCSLGQISDVLYQVGGRYRRSM
ncbi:MAG: methylmalonyl-CoA mutase family protein [Gammaproteobacteria bacterium]|nr:methylmalonyl-CoA mutase family protein [Gammaproteobacteria bacterium]